MNCSTFKDASREVWNCWVLDRFGIVELYVARCFWLVLPINRNVFDKKYPHLHF